MNKDMEAGPHLTQVHTPQVSSQASFYMWFLLPCSLAPYNLYLQWCLRAKCLKWHNTFSENVNSRPLTKLPELPVLGLSPSSCVALPPSLPPHGTANLQVLVLLLNEIPSLQLPIIKGHWLQHWWVSFSRTGMEAHLTLYNQGQGKNTSYHPTLYRFKGGTLTGTNRSIRVDSIK